MLKQILSILAIVSFAVACTGQQPVDNTKKTGKPQSFGEVITAKKAISYSDLVTQMANSEQVTTKVKGTVQSVCQAKGCWMNINDGKTSEQMFVKFKDYGFFMPKDIAGREVILEGYAFKDVTSVEDLRHFAEDEGKSKEEIEKITEPKQELKFMASGVLLLPESKK